MAGASVSRIPPTRRLTRIESAAKTVFETLFQFLFEYRPHVFRQGDFRFAPPAGAPVAAAVVIAARWRWPSSATACSASRVQWRERPVLGGAARSPRSAIILFCLFRPVLVVKAAVAQQNFLGVLIDDSRSMQIPDCEHGQPRADVRQGRRSASPTAAVMKALSERFLLRTFRFSSSTRAGRVAPGDLTFGGTQTRLGAARSRARGRSWPACRSPGLVLVSDGADTTDATVADALLASKAAALPVFTVGVGQETLAHDIQVGRVSTPRTALKGTSLLVDAVVTQTGYAGQTVTLDVEDERPHRRIAGGEAAGGRRAGVGAGAVHRDRGRAAGVPLQDRAAAGRARHAEQPARRADRRRAIASEQHPLLRRGAAPRDEVRAPRGQGRQEPRSWSRCSAPPRTSTCASRRRRGRSRARRRLPEDARGALRLSRADARQHRGGRVHRRSAADDRRVRRASAAAAC